MTSQDIDKLPFFCVLPWIGLSVSPNGKIHPCCLTTHTEFGDLTKTDLHSAYNSERFKHVRKEMLEGKYPYECSSCIEGEKINGYALRKHKNHLLKTSIPLILENSNIETGSLSKVIIKDTDIRFSNTCNFKCKMCCSIFSSRHAVDNKEKIVDHSSEIFEKTKECFNSVELCYFAGGEPFLMDKTYEVIDIISKRADYENIDVGFSTNLSVMQFKDYKTIEVLKKLKKVTLNCSLDGIGAVGEFIREGSNFNTFVDNSRLVKKECPHVKLGLHTVVSIYNVFDIPNMIEWIGNFKNIDSGLFSKPYFNFWSTNFVGGHPEMDIRNLDDENKEAVRSLYRETLKKYEGKNEGGFDFTVKLNTILTYIDGAPTYPFDKCIERMKGKEGYECVKFLNNIDLKIIKKSFTKKNLNGEYFCSSPFVNMSIYPDGLVYPCCKRGGGNAFGNIFKESIEDIWNGTSFTEMRKLMLDNIPCEFCNDCYNTSKTAISTQIQTNKGWLKYIEDNIQDIYEDGKFNIKHVKYLRIVPSFDCNLACRSCFPSDSSRWRKELNLDPFPDNSKKIYENIKKNIDLTNITVLSISGGEPFLNDVSYNLLKDISSSLSVRCCINTNLSILSHHENNFIDVIKTFKNRNNVTLSISLDEIEKNSEYVRYGTNWNNLLKNIDLLKNNCPEINILIWTVVSNYNIFRIPDIFNWVDFNIRPFFKNFEMQLSMLESPKELSIKILPEYLKNAIENKFSKSENKQFLMKRESILNFMKSKEYDKNLFEKFIVHVRKYDIQRNQYFLELFLDE